MAINRVETRLTARDETSRAFRTMQSNLGKVESAFLNVAKVAGALGAVFAGAFVRDLVSVNKEFQSLKASLITFTGSVENADGAFKILQEFAKNTPFSLQEVVGSFNLLVSQGIKPTEKQLMAFADISGGTSKSIMQFAEAVADASVGEFERLKEFGIKASKEGDNVTLRIGDLSKTVKNDSASIVAALTDIANTNFAGGAERQAQTLGGAITNLRDNVDAFLYSIGEQGFAGELTRAIKLLSNMVSGNDELAKSISDKLTVGLYATVAAVRFLVDNLDTMLLAFKVVFGIAIIRRIISVGKAVTNMAKAIVTSQVAITVFTGLFQKMTKRMKGGLLGIAAAAAALVGFDEEVRQFITDVADAIQINDMLAGVFDNLGLSTEALEANFKDLENELEGTNTNFLQNTGSILDFIPSVEGAGGAITDTSVASGKLADALDSMKKKIFPVEDALSDLKDEKAALQKMVASGIITFDEMETTLNSLAREALGLDTTLGDLKDRQSIAEKAFAAGIITGQEYKNIIAGLKDEMIDYNAENEKTFGAGAIKGVKDYYNSISDNAANMADFVGDAFGSLETTLSDFFYTGKLDFGTFTDAIKRGLADLAAKAVITTGLNFLGDVFPGLKFADGGLVPGSGGPRSDDVLARVSSGEYVIKAATVSKFGAGFFDQLNSGQMPMGGGGGGSLSIDAGIMEGLTPGFFLGGIIKGITNIIGGIVDAIKNVIKSVVDIVKDIVGAVTQAVRGLIEGIMSGDLATLIAVASMFILPGVGGAIASNLASGSGFINAVTTGIAESFSAGILGGGSLSSIATSVGVEAAKGVLTDGLSAALSDKILDITGGMARSKGSYAQGRADSFATLYNQSAPYLAAMTGANVHGGDNVRVGERGPEMFIPGRDGTIAPIKGNASELIGAVNEMKDEIITLRRQMSRMMSGGQLAGAR